MSHRVVRTLCLAVLCLAVAAAAWAQHQPACSQKRLAGAWGYTMTGTFILPSGAVPAAAVGSFVVNAEGELAGTQHFSLAGAASQETVRGMIDVNEDCTATMTLELYDGLDQLLRTTIWAVVFDDNGREARALLTSLTLANGMKIPTVTTANARKAFTNPVGK